MPRRSEPSDPHEDKPSPPSITGAAFWALMARWQVPDGLALQLIAGPAPAASGKRPRFRLISEQVERFQLLRAIDRHLIDLYRDPAGWLGKPIAAKPFGRRKPMEFMAEGGFGAIADTLRFLEREAFKNTRARSPGASAKV